MAHRWDDLVGKIRHLQKTINIKTETSTFTLTKEEKIKDIHLIYLLTDNQVYIHFQCNGSASTSVKNNSSILHHTTNIPSYSIGGI